MRDLPTEIWLKIVNDLGQRLHPLAYRLESGCSNALAALCGLNHTFRHAAEPLLYSTPYVTPETLQAFARTVVSAEADPSDPLRVLPSRKGQLVKQLAIVGFDKELDLRQTICIGTTLYALRPVITRLLFDVNMPHRDWLYPICDNDFVSIRHAMQGMSCLEELCAFEDFKTWHQLRWVSAWPRLKRLAFSKFNQPALRDMIDWMHELQTCVVYPDLEGTLVACEDLADYFLKRDRSQEMVLAVPMNQAQHYSIVTDRWKQMTDHPDRDVTMEVMKQSLQVVELPDTSSIAFHSFRERTAHFRATVLDGRIWNMAGVSWGEYIGTSTVV